MSLSLSLSLSLSHLSPEYEKEEFSLREGLLRFSQSVVAFRVCTLGFCAIGGKSTTDGERDISDLCLSLPSSFACRHVVHCE